MRKILIVSLLMFTVMAVAQRSTTFYVERFNGNTVGDKLKHAQEICNPANPCNLILNARLADLPNGAMPVRCANCTWLDYRTSDAPSIAGTGVVMASQRPGENC